MENTLWNIIIVLVLSLFISGCNDNWENEGGATKANTEESAEPAKEEIEKDENQEEPVKENSEETPTFLVTKSRNPGNTMILPGSIQLQDLGLFYFSINNPLTEDCAVTQITMTNLGYGQVGHSILNGYAVPIETAQNHDSWAEQIWEYDRETMTLDLPKAKISGGATSEFVFVTESTAWAEEGSVIAWSLQGMELSCNNGMFYSLSVTGVESDIFWIQQKILTMYNLESGKFTLNVRSVDPDDKTVIIERIRPFFTTQTYDGSELAELTEGEVSLFSEITPIDVDGLGMATFSPHLEVSNSTEFMVNVSENITVLPLVHGDFMQSTLAKSFMWSPDGVRLFDTVMLGEKPESRSSYRAKKKTIQNEVNRWLRQNKPSTKSRRIKNPIPFEATVEKPLMQ